MLKASETNPKKSPHLVRSEAAIPIASADPRLLRAAGSDETDPEPEGSAPVAVASYFETALQLIVERAQNDTGASGAAIALGDASLMVCRASIGAAPEAGVQLRPDAGLSGLCLRTGEVVQCTDTQADPRVNAAAARSLNLGSVVILPVFAGGRLAGVLQVMSPRPQAFGSRELSCLEQFASVLSSTIEKHQRIEQFLVAPEAVDSAPASVSDSPETEVLEQQAPSLTPTASAQPVAAASTGTEARIASAPAGWWTLARARLTLAPSDLIRIAAPIFVLAVLLGSGWYVRHRSAERANVTPALAADTATAAAPAEPPQAAALLKTEAPPATASKPPATGATANAELTRSFKVSTGPTPRALVTRVKQMKVGDIAPLERRAKSGDPEAQVTLGLAYGEGNLLIHDPAQAVTWYRKAAEQGYGPAEEALGVAYQTGNGVAKDGVKAVQWYTRAAQHGSLMAANELGMMFSSGTGVKQSFTEAWKWYSIAAERGDASAQYNLSRMYHLGQGVRANPALEFQWLSKAANQGLPSAQFSLALMYQEGIGVKADVAEAARLLRKAADQGDRLAQMQLGYAYLKGLGVPVDNQQSLKWYRMAAEKGEPTAAYALSVRYFSGGQGVTQNYAEAGKWTKVAAENGHPDARYNLGVMYEEGVGIAPDPVEAAKWYRRAADQGVASAKLRLGLMYASGKGIPKDPINAYMWISLSEDEAKESADRLRALRKQMTPDQLREAEREISDWRAAHPERQP